MKSLDFHEFFLVQQLEGKVERGGRIAGVFIVEIHSTYKTAIAMFGAYLFGSRLVGSFEVPNHVSFIALIFEKYRYTIRYFLSMYLGWMSWVNTEVLTKIIERGAELQIKTRSRYLLRSAR